MTTQVSSEVWIPFQIISAIRAGIPDELRGQLWKGFSGAAELQRRAELKQSIRRASKTTNFRLLSSSRETPTASTSDVAATAPPVTLYEEYALPIDPNATRSPENQMLFARLRALALREAQHAIVHGTDLTLPVCLNRSESDISVQYERQSRIERGSLMASARAIEVDDDTEDDEVAVDTPKAAARNTLKQLEKGRLGEYVYPSDSPSAEWEMAARRRVLIANSRYK